MLGTIIDTLIICTMTGLTIVITDSWNVGLDGVDVTTRAFQQGLPFNSSIASFILMVCLVFIYHDPRLGLLQREMPGIPDRSEAEGDQSIPLDLHCLRIHWTLHDC